MKTTVETGKAQQNQQSAWFMQRHFADKTMIKLNIEYKKKYGFLRYKSVENITSPLSLVPPLGYLSTSSKLLL